MDIMYSYSITLNGTLQFCTLIGVNPMKLTYKKHNICTFPLYAGNTITSFAKNGFDSKQMTRKNIKENLSLRLQCNHINRSC